VDGKVCCGGPDWGSAVTLCHRRFPSKDFQFARPERQPDAGDSSLDEYSQSGVSRMNWVRCPNGSSGVSYLTLIVRPIASSSLHD
jgi:hypothetical protein